MENVLSKKDLSRNLGLSIGKIDKMMGEGLSYLKIGRSVRFRESDVDRFLNEHPNLNIKTLLWGRTPTAYIIKN